MKGWRVMKTWNAWCSFGALVVVMAGCPGGGDDTEGSAETNAPATEPATGTGSGTGDEPTTGADSNPFFTTADVFASIRGASGVDDKVEYNLFFTDFADACPVYEAGNRKAGSFELNLELEREAPAGMAATWSPAVLEIGAPNVQPNGDQVGVQVRPDKYDATCTSADFDDILGGTVTITDATDTRIAGSVELQLKTGTIVAGFDTDMCPVAEGPPTGCDP